MLDREKKIKQINNNIQECEIEDINGGVYSSIYSTNIFSIVDWALKNAPDEKINLWHKETFCSFSEAQINYHKRKGENNVNS